MNKDKILNYPNEYPSIKRRGVKYTLKKAPHTLALYLVQEWGETLRISLSTYCEWHTLEKFIGD